MQLVFCETVLQVLSTVLNVSLRQDVEFKGLLDVVLGTNSLETHCGSGGEGFCWQRVGLQAPKTRRKELPHQSKSLTGWWCGLLSASPILLETESQSLPRWRLEGGFSDAHTEMAFSPMGVSLYTPQPFHAFIPLCPHRSPVLCCRESSAGWHLRGQSQK